MSFVGVRVVRGPDWEWGDQDRGEGNVGTVCQDSSNVVIVKWDQGCCKNYRAGFNNCYDLRIFDNSYLGVLHKNICEGCNSKIIIGLKFSCCTCKGSDLCASCYNNDKHNTTHAFTLFPTKTSIGIDLPSRICSKKVSFNSQTAYYYNHLPVLGRNYEQTVRTETKPESEQIQTLDEVERCIGCSKPSSENVTFKPCNHKLTCIDCSDFFKICVVCRVPIRQRIALNGNVLPNPEDARLHKLENIIHELEELYFCGICTQNVANILFNCGHKACQKCTQRLISCHMCRKIISLRFPI